MIITRTDILSGATPQRVKDLAAGLAPPRLADLAVRLAEDPDLRVSVITYDHGGQALEVLHAGLPRHTEHTIDYRRFTGRAAPPARSLSITSHAGLQHTVGLVRATLPAAGAVPDGTACQ